MGNSSSTGPHITPLTLWVAGALGVSLNGNFWILGLLAP